MHSLLNVIKYSMLYGAGRGNAVKQLAVIPLPILTNIGQANKSQSGTRLTWLDSLHVPAAYCGEKDCNSSCTERCHYRTPGPVMAAVWDTSIGCLLELYVLATSKVISGWVLTCDSAHSWWLYSAAPLGDWIICTMSEYPIWSDYLASLFPYLNNAECPARKRQVSIIKSLVWLAYLSTIIIYQRGRRLLNSFGHPVWSVWEAVRHCTLLVI